MYTMVHGTPYAALCTPDVPRASYTHRLAPHPFPDYYYKQSADLKNYVDYLDNAYSCFLEGEDEALQGITTEFSEAREADDAGAEEFLEKLEEANETLRQTNQEVLLLFLTDSGFYLVLFVMIACDDHGNLCFTRGISTEQLIEALLYCCAYGNDV